MVKSILLLAISCIIFSELSGQNSTDKFIVSDSLQIIPLSKNVYLHVSELNSKEFGKVPCNGLIYINGSEAVFMDTPPTEGLSQQLLAWFHKTFPAVKAKAIIINHFHADCLGGLRAFHDLGVTSYSHVLTPELLKLRKESFALPKVNFDETLILNIGESKVVARYFGEGHTRDNVVTWIEDEKTLFGGCVVKAMNAGKGNLADANVVAWPSTVAKMKAEFSSARYIIPGHGNHGGIELLDYTIKLFSSK